MRNFLTIILKCRDCIWGVTSTWGTNNFFSDQQEENCCGTQFSFFHIFWRMGPFCWKASSKLGLINKKLFYFKQLLDRISPLNFSVEQCFPNWCSVAHGSGAIAGKPWESRVCVQTAQRKDCPLLSPYRFFTHSHIKIKAIGRATGKEPIISPTYLQRGHFLLCARIKLLGAVLQEVPHWECHFSIIYNVPDGILIIRTRQWWF